MNTFPNGADFIQLGDKEYLVTASSISKFFDSKVYINEIEENEKGSIRKKYLSHFTLPPMAEEVCAFQDNYGVTNLAIGNESFSKRYEINRRAISPKGITVIDFSKILEIKKKDKVTPKINAVAYIDADIEKKKSRNNGQITIDDDNER